MRKLTDYLGVLRTVVFCTEDLQLAKGVARARRRFLDLLLSQTYPGYLPLLQRAQQSSGQVFMTATEESWPEEPGRERQRWRVKDGTLLKESK